MGKIALVTGGCRSGKSAYAQQLAEAFPRSRLYVATCPIIDEEMRQRIEAHRRDRAGRGWETVEEEIDLARVLGDCSHNVVLVDCITLWVNNLMYRAEREGGTIDEEQIAEACSTLLEAATSCPPAVILVTNEVGLGIVPDNAQARRYRDLVGRANQVIATRADSVTLVVCGIPTQLKGNLPTPAGPPSNH